MSNSSPILEYSLPPRRRRRWVVIGVLVAMALASGLYIRGRAKPAVAKMLYNVAFARSFDDISTELLARDSTWSAKGASPQQAARADTLLRTLISKAGAGTGSYLRNQNTVLFVRSGQTDARKWLAFACVSPTGLEVFSFERGYPSACGYDRVATMPAFFSNENRFEVSLRELYASGDDVHTVIDINGGTNQLVWTFAPPAPPSNRTMAYAPRGFDVSAKPSTGWMRDQDWWPDVGGVRLLEGPAAAQVLPSIAKPHAISFVSADRLAVVSPREVGLIDVANRLLAKTFPLKGAGRDPEIFAFSLDGTRAFIGGTSEPAQVVDVLTGRLSWAGETAGMAKPAFVGSDVLMLADNVSFTRIDLTRRRAAEPMPPYAAGTWHSAAAGNFLAIDSRDSIKVHSADTGQQLWTVTHTEFYPLLSMSPDARWLVSKSTASLRAFDVASGKPLWGHTNDNDLHTSHSRIKWSLDGRRGAAAGNRFVYVWSLAEPRWAARFPHGQSGYHPDVALSPDGRRMAASARNATSIAYWNDLDAVLPR